MYGASYGLSSPYRKYESTSISPVSLPVESSKLTLSVLIVFFCDEPITSPKKRGWPNTKRGQIEDEIVSLADVRCTQRLGGLLKSYSRNAA